MSKSERKIDPSALKYLSGFGSEHATEALEGALPKGQNTPQLCPYGLYAEQLSGTSFTTPRSSNQRSWLYRIRPTVAHKPFKPCEGKDANSRIANDFSQAIVNPSQLRWKPFPLPDEKEQIDFIQGLSTVCGAGSPDIKAGLAVHVYACNVSMNKKAFCNSDGDFLIVPQLGNLLLRTEFGYLYVKPGEIAVVQRGITYSVEVEGPSRGYICEVYNGHFKLPELGPIGANGLAAPRDFLYPVAAYEDNDSVHQIIQKFSGQLFTYERTGSPFDVVAWHGNYAPFKYDLSLFCVINSVSFDHLDPSIFTVLSCPTGEPGVSCVDFAIFPPRWAVQEKTFRPPYYHRNVMSEFMGNIKGQYDAKPDGFNPGGASLHSIMCGHGPDAQAFRNASVAELKPTYMGDQLAFMFESTYSLRLTKWSMEEAPLDREYYKCWEPLPKVFDPQNKDAKIQKQ